MPCSPLWETPPYEHNADCQSSESRDSCTHRSVSWFTQSFKESCSYLFMAVFGSGFKCDYLVKTSSGVLVPHPGRDEVFPNCSLRGCFPCSFTMMPSFTGSQSMLGTSSWLGSRQHSSIRLSSGSWGGPSSRADSENMESVEQNQELSEPQCEHVLTAQPQLGEQSEQQLHAVLVV